MSRISISVLSYQFVRIVIDATNDRCIVGGIMINLTHITETYTARKIAFIQSALTDDEIAEIIETVSLYQNVASLDAALRYAIEDEEALEAISHIADFGL